MAQTNKQAINFTTQVCARKAFDEKALKCIWQIFFLFAWLNLPNVLRSIATFFFDSDFPAPCFDVPKASNFTSGGVQNRETKTRRLGTIVTSFPDFKLRENQISPIFAYFLINNTLMYHFLANWLAHNEKMTEKSVFREDWSPEMTSESFPISCFWSCGFVPHWKWNLTLLVHQNRGKENRYQKFFFALHISTLRRFNRENKKKVCHCQRAQPSKDARLARRQQYRAVRIAEKISSVCKVTFLL